MRRWPVPVLAVAVLLASGVAGCGGGSSPAAAVAPGSVAGAASPSPALSTLGRHVATVAAGGDVACPVGGASCADAATAGVIARIGPQALLALGDLQYDTGTLADFRSAYARTWGRFRSITLPAVGNHEYGTAGAAGYFTYFGRRAGRRGEGWYARSIGSWRVIALNSNCVEAGGCERGSPQQRWLAAELAAHPARCTVAIWHHPRFSSGRHGDDPRTAALWATLRARRADLVLVGHEHDYERFSPQNSDGRRDVRGMREFVVGTGGRANYSFTRTRPNSEVRATDLHGVLELDLRARGYRWSFRAVPGDGFSDAGTARCM
jgi:hypothetical protein